MSTYNKPALEDFLNNPHEYEPSIHPNGFICIPIKEKHELHIWSSSIQRPHPSIRIHNHDWTLLTTILYGIYWQYAYKTIPHPSKITHDVVDFIKLEQHYPPIMLEQKPLKKYTTGDYFVIHTGHYHSAWHDGPTCNIVNLLNTRKTIFNPRIAVPQGIAPIRDKITGLHASAVPLIVKGACSKIEASLRR